MIKVDQVSMKFNLASEKFDSLKEYIIKSIKRQVSFDEFWALNDVSFNVYKGDALGLIGLNGSGKSTMLKTIAGVLKPTKGSVKVHGTVAPLIELGAGFHQDFTGRENIYFNGSLYGLSKKNIDEKIEEIIKFSELENFIDNPIRTYSSGMLIRLAFSIVINIDADIYLFDEILAVGDNHFQKKCLKKIQELKKMNKTIIVVSHDLDLVKNIGTRAIWLNNGKIYKDGVTKEIINMYLKESVNVERYF